MGEIKREPRKEIKRINIDSVVDFLNRAFLAAARKAGPVIGTRATRSINKKGEIETTAMYDYQVEFTHLVNDIQRGPRYIAPKLIQEANELIAKLEAEAA